MRKLTFDSNGGSVVASSTAPYDTVVVEPIEPTRMGYNFVGWYDEPALTTPHDFTVGLTVNMTVYAKWEADLTAYNAALAAVVEADYTPTSWTAYQAVVTANVVTVDNTSEEVATATANIVAAQANLVAVAQSASSDAELAALLADPEITDITLGAGSYSTPMAPTEGLKITGPNAGLAPDDPNRVEEAVLTGGIEASNGGLELDGVTVSGKGAFAIGTGDVTVKNTIISDVDTGSSGGGATSVIALEARGTGNVVIENVKIINVSGAPKAMGIRIRDAVTGITIKNCHIENVGHNAINIYGTANLAQVDILDNTLIHWDSDMDATDGGRAIRIDFTNTAPFTANIKGNTMTAPDYAGADKTPTDPEYIKITNLSKLTSLVLDNNTISEPIPGQWILSAGLAGTTPEPTNNISIDDGPVSAVDSATLTPADFLKKITVTP